MLKPRIVLISDALKARENLVRQLSAKGSLSGFDRNQKPRERMADHKAALAAKIQMADAPAESRAEDDRS
ncbi:hypothetical protein JCM17846_25510 [Iodidimonas nitroreducens]|uniref:Uncharacterized protein n=1 Tax=Iodidimonas nitroreducens TaxID=1236968 RepID=A0A5A7NCS7_9PROT|nr:hypothetical protein JCM17846_25510 [Iodidimonas nitroreducens]